MPAYTVQCTGMKFQCECTAMCQAIVRYTTPDKVEMIYATGDYNLAGIYADHTDSASAPGGAITGNGGAIESKYCEDPGVLKTKRTDYWFSSSDTECPIAACPQDEWNFQCQSYFQKIVDRLQAEGKVVIPEAPSHGYNANIMSLPSTVIEFGSCN